jgi:hypothetical protein
VGAGVLVGKAVGADVAGAAVAGAGVAGTAVAVAGAVVAVSRAVAVAAGAVGEGGWAVLVAPVPGMIKGGALAEGVAWLVNAALGVRSPATGTTSSAAWVRRRIPGKDIPPISTGTSKKNRITFHLVFDGKRKPSFFNCS